MMTARRQCFNLVEKVLYKQAYLNLELQGIKDQPGFIKHLAMTFLKNKTLLEAQWKPFVSRLPHPKIRLLLTMFCGEYYLMDGTPGPILVSLYVDLAKKVQPHQASLVNALCRKLLTKPLIQEGPLSIMTSHPEWLIDLWRSYLGNQETKELCYFNQTQAPIYVQSNSHKSNREDLLETGLVSEVGKDLIAGPGFFESPLLAQGLALVQDKASFNLVESIDFSGIHSCLDACSGPGTKTLQLVNHLGASQVTSLELHPHRAELVQELLARSGYPKYSVWVGDSRTYQSDKTYDLVFIDAPCFGLGLLRRKPDLRWRLDPKDLEALVVIQQELLDHLSNFVSPGGLLVYATCSLSYQENQGQIRRFLERHPRFCLEESQLVLPYLENTDGFYLAQLRCSRVK